MTTCICPKCNDELPIDVSVIPEEGAFHKCHACNASLLVRKVSFAQRALHKSTDIACAECGNPPGAAIYCESCHTIYPEILVIETTSAVKKLLASLTASSKHSKTTERTHRERAGAATESFERTANKGVSKSAGLAVTLLLILALTAGGGYFWYQNKIDTKYSQQYVKMIVALKTARDMEIGVSNRVIASWQAGTGSALNDKEQKSTASAKKDVDTLLKMMDKVPEKFKQNHDAIKKLYENFGKLHESVTMPSGTFEIYNGSVTKADAEFMKNAKQLQSGLPDKISAIYSESKKKYKALQDF